MDRIREVDPPGAILLEHIRRHGLTRIQFAAWCRISIANLNLIIQDKQRLTYDMAMRFGHVFPEASAEYWITSQVLWDLRKFAKRWKAPPDVVPLAPTQERFTKPKHLDNCICGHKGWQHTHSAGGCTLCDCTVYMSFGALVAARKGTTLDEMVSIINKEEESQRDWELARIRRRQIFSELRAEREEEKQDWDKIKQLRKAERARAKRISRWSTIMRKKRGIR